MNICSSLKNAKCQHLRCKLVYRGLRYKHSDFALTLLPLFTDSLNMFFWHHGQPCHSYDIIARLKQVMITAGSDLP